MYPAADQEQLGLAHGELNKWFQIIGYDNSNTYFQVFIKIDANGFIYAYKKTDIEKGYRTQYQDCFITVYNELANPASIGDKYKVDFNLITARENPTTCIFRNMTGLDNFVLWNDSSQSNKYRNWFQLSSPINSQPMTIKLYLSGKDTNSYNPSNFSNYRLHLRTLKDDSCLIDDDQLLPPEVGKTKCYTFSNVVLSNFSSSTIYFGFDTEPHRTSSGSGVLYYFKLEGVEIYQDLELNGSFPPNKEELIISANNYNQIKFSPSGDSSGTLLSNEL